MLLYHLLFPVQIALFISELKDRHTVLLSHLLFPIQVAVFISKLMADSEKKTELLQVIGQKDYKVSYLHYNWDVNSQH